MQDQRSVVEGSGEGSQFFGEEDESSLAVQDAETARLTAYDFVSRANDHSVRRRGGGALRREFLLAQSS